MCTYTYQKAVCPCAKGLNCAQIATAGGVLIEGEYFHVARDLHCVDSLGAACDFQRRLHGRNARASQLCPRYNPNDPKKRMIEGIYKNELACIHCVVTCPPPGSQAVAPSQPPVPERENEGGRLPRLERDAFGIWRQVTDSMDVGEWASGEDMPIARDGGRR